ncbi:MAG: ribonuclease III [Clostridiales bacterium]|nr:ribonuclease III [Clostridiales bacterium]
MQTAEIEQTIGYTFRDKDLLEVAFTHASYTNEHYCENNERLEFLGDSVLNFIVAELLYFSAKEDEGTMSASRASIVSREPLAAAVEKLGLMNHLRMSQGVSNPRNWSTKFKSNIFEAVLGAIYLDGGMESAKRFVYNHLGRDIAKNTIVDYKSRLIEYKQAKYNDLDIKFEVSDDNGGGFVCKIYLGGEFISEGKGRKKKLAERNAAEAALKKFNVI